MANSGGCGNGGCGGGRGDSGGRMGGGGAWAAGAAVPSCPRACATATGLSKHLPENNLDFKIQNSFIRGQGTQRGSLAREKQNTFPLWNHPLSPVSSCGQYPGRRSAGARLTSSSPASRACSPTSHATNCCCSPCPYRSRSTCRARAILPPGRRTHCAQRKNFFTRSCDLAVPLTWPSD